MNVKLTFWNMTKFGLTLIIVFSLMIFSKPIHVEASTITFNYVSFNKYTLNSMSTVSGISSSVPYFFAPENDVITPILPNTAVDIGSYYTVVYGSSVVNKPSVAYNQHLYAVRSTDYNGNIEAFTQYYWYSAGKYKLVYPCTSTTSNIMSSIFTLSTNDILSGTMTMTAGHSYEIGLSFNGLGTNVNFLVSDPYPIVGSGYVKTSLNNDMIFPCDFYMSSTGASVSISIHDVILQRDFTGTQTFIFVWDMPEGISFSNSANDTVKNSTAGITYSSSLTGNIDSINDSLNNAHGENNSLNNSNQQVDSTLQDYKDKTDTTDQKDIIDNNFNFDFDTSIFTQIAATSTLFSSNVTLLWTNLYDLQTVLSLFLISAVVGLIIGIINHSKGG